MSEIPADELGAELERLRARDEAATAALRDEHARHEMETAEVEDVHGISEVTYCGYDGHTWPCPTVDALDALARTHEDGGPTRRTPAEKRLWRWANSEEHRDTEAASDVHVLLSALERRRAQDEAVTAVAQVWAEMRGRPNARFPVPLVVALDALARTHEDGGQGR